MNSETVSILNDLIQALEDGKECFQTAAADVTDVRVKSTLGQLAGAYELLAGELQEQVYALGERPETAGTVGGAMHRGWMNLRSALGGGEKAMLSEAERVEDWAVKLYQKALEQDLPAEIAEIIRRQAAEVRQTHDQVRAMRDSWT